MSGKDASEHEEGEIVDDSEAERGCVGHLNDSVVRTSSLSRDEHIFFLLVSARIREEGEVACLEKYPDEMEVYHELKTFVTQEQCEFRRNLVSRVRAWGVSVEDSHVSSQVERYRSLSFHRVAEMPRFYVSRQILELQAELSIQEAIEEGEMRKKAQRTPFQEKKDPLPLFRCERLLLSEGTPLKVSGLARGVAIPDGELPVKEEFKYDGVAVKKVLDMVCDRARRRHLVTVVCSTSSLACLVKLAHEWILSFRVESWENERLVFIEPPLPDKILSEREKLTIYCRQQISRMLADKTTSAKAVSYRLWTLGSNIQCIVRSSTRFAVAIDEQHAGNSLHPIALSVSMDSEERGTAAMPTVLETASDWIRTTVLGMDGRLLKVNVSKQTRTVLSTDVISAREVIPDDSFFSPHRAQQIFLRVMRAAASCDPGSYLLDHARNSSSVAILAQAAGETPGPKFDLVKESTNLGAHDSPIHPPMTKSSVHVPYTFACINEPNE